TAPASFAGVTRFSEFKPALVDVSHPDHGLARLFADFDPVRLPLMSSDTLCEALIKNLDPADLERAAGPAEIATIHRRLFAGKAAPECRSANGLQSGAKVRDVYRSAVKSAAFKAALGRISASSAW